MRFWNVLHRRAAIAHTSLYTRTVSPEPSELSHTHTQSMEANEMSGQTLYT